MDIQKGADYDESAPFQSYVTYHISNSTLQIPPVEAALEKRLQSMGYQTSKQPNLMIYYRLVGENASILSMNQPSISHTINTSEAAGAISYRKLQLREQSLIINFYDTALKRVVWRGYLSNDYLTQPSRITSGVYLVMDEFRLIQSQKREEGKSLALR